MDPRKFLAYAKSLASAIRGPAEHQSAISRAYYAAYNVTVDFLKNKAGLEPFGDKHRAVKSSLLFCKNTAANQLGVKLDTLHTERKKADYELGNTDPEQSSTVTRACKLSEDFINGLDGFTGQQQAQLVQAVQSWARQPQSSLRTV